MSTLCTHKNGSKRVEFNDLVAIETPPPTETWVPIGHAEMAANMKRWSTDVLPSNFSLQSEQYAVARGGNQMFGLMTFKNGSSEMGLSIGFRNSINKSLGAAIALGGSVFVCDNLALRGDIMVMRKHTLYVIEDFQNIALNAIGKAAATFEGMLEHSEALKQISYTDHEAFERMGVLYGNGVLTPRQLPVVLKEWKNPQHREFEPRTAWSLYNAATEAMKSCPPQTIMEKHTLLTKAFA